MCTFLDLRTLTSSAVMAEVSSRNPVVSRVNKREVPNHRMLCHSMVIFGRKSSLAVWLTSNATDSPAVGGLACDRNCTVPVGCLKKSGCFVVKEIFEGFNS